MGERLSLSSERFKPRSHIPCDCDVIALRPKKMDNRREVSKVSERFNWSRQKISDRLPDQIGCELSFEHAQNTDRD